MKPRILSTSRLSLPLVAAIAALLAAQSAHGQSGNWNVDAGGNWSNASNWNPAAVPGTAAGDVIGLNNNIGAARTVTIDAASVTAGILNIGDSNSTHAFSLARTGSNILILDNGVNSAQINKTTTVADIISAPIQLNSNLAVSATGQITLSGGITESGGAKNLIKSGAGALVLNGGSGYTGTTEVAAGTLRLVTQASLYDNDDTKWTAANINVKSGATLAFNVGGATQFTDAAITTLLANLASSSSATNGMNAGSNFAFNTDTTPNFFTLSGLIADSTGTSGGARGLQKLGIGTLVLTNANTYTGATTISGGTLRLENTTASSSITLASGSTSLELATDTAYSGPLIVSTAGTIVSDRATAGAGLTHAFSGVSRLGSGNTNITAGANVTSGTAAIQLADVSNNSASTANFGFNPTTANLIITGGVTMGTSNTGTANFTLGGTGSVNSVGGGIVNGTRGTGNLIKSGTSTWTLSGANTYTGSTAVNGGLLVLDYGSGQNNSKLASGTGAVLTLGNATLELKGGSHTETVLSTTLTAGTASRVTRSSGTSVLQMNAITRGAGATIDFSAPGIASTDTLNTNGILGTWATIAGTDFARNSTNGADGLITAAAYTDVTRLSSGTKVVANGVASNVRIIEGTGAAADITLAAATTTINTLNQSIDGGTGDATIDFGGQTLRTNAILSGPTAGLLTLGNGTLATATSGGELRLINNSANGITINSTIADNTSASSLIKQGTGLVTLGTANSYTGATTINQGTLTIGPTGSLGSTTAALAVNNDNSGAGTDTILNLTSGGDTTVGTLTGAIVAPASGTNTVTINTGGAGLGFIVNQGAAGTYAGTIAGAGNFTYNGSATNSLTLSGANTYTGTTSIGANGLLILSNVDALGGNTPGVNGTSSISINAGATLQQGAGAGSNIAIAAPITLNGTGDITLRMGNGAASTTTTLTLNGAIGGSTGNVVYSTGAATFGNGTSLFVLGAAGSYTGDTLITTGNGANNPVFLRAGAGVVDALPKTTVLTFAGDVGGGTGRIFQYDMNGNDQTLAGLTNTVASLRRQTFTNSGSLATLTIENTDDMSFGGSSLTSGSTNRAQLTGAINLTKSGPGTFTLGGTLLGGATAGGNTHTGATKVSEGVLVLGEFNSLQNSAFDTTGSVTGDDTNGLRATTMTLTLGGLTGNKNFANVFETDTGGYSGINALTLNPVSGATHSYSGDISNGASGMTLTKTGAGTQILAGASTYTGATLVSAGTLFVTGSITSDVTVSDAATLGGGGSVQAVSFGGGAFFDIFLPLDSSDSLAATTISFAATGFGIDNLVSQGTAVDWASVADGTYTLITGTLDPANLDNLGVANAYPIGGNRSAYFQNGSLQLVVIPEPSAAVLGGLGLLALLRRRRQ